MFFQKLPFKICGIISSSPLPCSHISAYKPACRKYKRSTFKTTTSNLPTKPTDWWTWKPCTMKPVWNTHWKWNGCKNKIFPRNILQFVSITFTRTSEKSYLFRILQNIYSCIPVIFPNSFKSKWAVPFTVISSYKKWRRQKICCVIRIIPAGALPLRLPFPPRAILFSCSKNTRT